MRLLYRGIRRFCSNSAERRICIVGGGPAGFYSAQYLAGHLPNCKIDIAEKLPVPFGLVRYGVAPDHPDVKIVVNTFTKTANLPNVQFLGNITLGQDYRLKDLQERYHAVLLTYGAERDRQLGLPNEDQLPKVISAREFVAYYNGLPGAENLNPDLSGDVVSIIGQGNVAIDIARVLLSPLDALAKTDITEYALETLRSSRVKQVNVIGRRGPLQSAFTIKELREMIKLPNCKSLWRPEDFNGIPEVVKDLARPRKRITELMLDSMSKQTSAIAPNEKIFSPIFLRSPKSIEVTSEGQQLHLTVNTLNGDRAEATNEMETIKSDLIFRSIGYKSMSYDPDLNFDDRQGCVNNVEGRVLKPGSDNDVEPGLYTGGWLATGPTGVILTTMNNAFRIASLICEDFKNNQIPGADQAKPGLTGGGENLLAGKRIVDWAAWERINEAEQKAGAARNKPREKFVKIEDMLKAAQV